MVLRSSPDHDRLEDIPRPFSLRLTQAQRQELETRASGMPLGEYIRTQLFAGQTAARPVNRRPNKPVKDHAALAEVLAKLGASRLASNMNQLARAANSGALPVTAETEAELRTACRGIAAMKAMLMTALGHRENTRR